jgi:hypothetical protein
MHPMHCMLWLVSHIYIFALDPAKPKLKELLELAPAEETNPKQEQGKPWCI